jgi:hypothetical protein
MMKLTKAELTVFGLGWILFVIAGIGMVSSGQPIQPTFIQPIFFYFTVMGLAGLSLILLGHIIRNKRMQKIESADNKITA